MSVKTWSLVLIVAGVLVLAVSLLADAIGLGAQPGVFGWKQVLGSAAGFLGCMAGLALLWLRGR